MNLPPPPPGRSFGFGLREAIVLALLTSGVAIAIALSHL